MHLRHGIVALLLTITAAAQQTPPIPIDTYIHQSWDQLQRSSLDCASVSEAKTPTTLYLPAEQKLTPELRGLQQRCNVRLAHLPRRIRMLGDLDPSELPTPGLLYLPNPYVASTAASNQMPGWDSYFLLLGELADNRLDLARGTLGNFFYEVDHYGAVLAANHTDSLTRSQQPFLSSMVLALYNAELPTDPKAAHDLLRESLPYLLRDHNLWITTPHLDLTTGLSRYFDLGEGPAPELRNDITYYTAILQWLIAHPSPANVTYLQPAPACVATTCPQPHVDNQSLSAAFYQGDRSMRESGFISSFRFGPFSGSTQDFAPVELNALLYKYERDIAFIHATLGDPANAIIWSSTAGDRLNAINSLMWDETSGLYYDFNLRTHRRSTYHYLTAYYALWAGIASPAKAARLLAALPLFERAGGLTISTFNSGQAWDEPYGNAPTTWLTLAGLINGGYIGQGLSVARDFTTTIANNYSYDHATREKYDVSTTSASHAMAPDPAAAGSSWTNAIYAAMQQLLHDPKLLNAPQQPPLASPPPASQPASPPSQNQ